MGKNADLIVVDRNPFLEGAGPIGDTLVELTMVGGRVVFEW
jgi:predicted amidohydrolase YtcJ